jgi:DnaK suppressor protein
MVPMSEKIDKDFVETQKLKLMSMKNTLLNQIKNKSNEDLHVPSDEIIEEGDQAATYLNQNVTFGLRERELRRLREVEHALSKINNGSYGLCEDYDIPIERKRLEKMPWARLCIEAAEDMERQEKLRYN